MPLNNVKSEPLKDEPTDEPEEKFVTVNIIIHNQGASRYVH